MTGFQQTFFGKELHLIAAFFGHEISEAIALLQPSITAVESEIKSHGLDVVKAAAAAAATAISAAKADGKSNSEAGQAGLAAAETAAVAGAITLGTDALHAIATASVTAASA